MALVDVLLPPACAGCGRYGQLLCARCVARLRPPSRDEERFVAADPGVVIGDALELGVAAFGYESALRRALGRLKYGGAARVAAPLARAALPAFEALLAAITGQPPALVPVPVHPERQRQRGYNQAALIATELSRLRPLRVAAVLERRRPTVQQHRLDRAARLRNLRDAFDLIHGARSPPVAILVDDILTTSATLEACATILRRHGSQRVYGFAIAREV
jgi:ComF family protein